MTWLEEEASFRKLLYRELWVKEFLTILPNNEEKVSYVGTASTLQEPGLIASFTKQCKEREFDTNMGNLLSGEQRTEKRMRIAWWWLFFLYLIQPGETKCNQNLCGQQHSQTLQNLYEAAEQAKFIRSLHIKPHWWFFLLHHFAIIQRINLLPLLHGDWRNIYINFRVKILIFYTSTTLCFCFNNSR